MSEIRLKTALISQAKSCRMLGSEFSATLFEVVAAHLPMEGRVWQRMIHWDGDLSSQSHSVPLRLAGALHALVLFEKAPGLAAVYPPHHLDLPKEALWKAVVEAISQNEDFVDHWLDSAPQTNEIRRSAILLPGFMETCKRTGLQRFKISELGASAGLNQIWDQFHYDFAGRSWGDSNSKVSLEPEVKGILPPLCDVEVVDRAAVDLKPVNLESKEERLRLMSYIWPDQQDRMERTAAGIEMLLSTEDLKPVYQGDAIEWLEDRLRDPVDGTVHVIYNTIAWQYFPNERQQAGRALLERAGNQASETAPLAWLSFEADGEEPGAALSLTLWPGGETVKLARGDYHGRWINWLI
ncbi:DUF2332 domain-containing protein [Sneathiella limimaris]|uniref:DUF2332 domain-containing protein n=1 Tax=Sneathiella limimaris TaxID=1964213 RepID=UPI00146AABF1|nr:DUF2332 family protein [Sneathiella limimaris]